jgi:hypothetical protein
MRGILVIGVLMVIVGLVALAVPSFTYFTTERVADVGFFQIDVSRPHTIIINPIVGGLILLAGAVLIFAGSSKASS